MTRRTAPHPRNAFALVRTRKDPLSLNDVIRLRPATLDDVGFVNGLTWRTMHKMVEQTWPDLSHQARYWQINGCDVENTRIIELNGEKIGRITTSLRKDDPIFGIVYSLKSFISSQNMLAEGLVQR